MTLLRLALATAVVLAPGWAVARALGVRTVSATLAWSLALLFGALAVTFLVSGSLALTLLLLLGAGIGALVAGRRAPRGELVPGRWWVLAAGAVLGVLLWHVSGEIGGDGLFHLARVRKLDAFGSLSLDSVNEFPDGGLHPGYAFPLWHAFLALVARVAFLDPSDVVLHEASVLAPVALLVTYEAAWTLFRRVGPAVAAVCAQVSLTALAPDGGGAYTALGLPATASRQLLVPAAVALAFGAVESRTRALLASAGAAGLALAVVHPTYALFLWLPFGGFLVVRAVVARREAVPIGAALAALAVPAGLFLAWLLPVVRDTRSVSPGTREVRRALEQYSGQLDVLSPTSYRLAPEVFGRSGAVAVGALLAIPLAGLALRARWAAFVLGGSLAVLAVMLVPTLFVHLSHAVSLSHSRRAAGSTTPAPTSTAGSREVPGAPAVPAGCGCTPCSLPSPSTGPASRCACCAPPRTTSARSPGSARSSRPPNSCCARSSRRGSRCWSPAGPAPARPRSSPPCSARSTRPSGSSRSRTRRSSSRGTRRSSASSRAPRTSRARAA
jgi:hypothetical protein